jgi:multiple sugar transport system ATP-binding protein
MAAVTFHCVSKTYRGGVAAIDDLSLEVADGELLVLIGPSGCGKTTALRLIAGLEEPTRGSIAVGGRTLDGVPPKDRDVAMVFQSDTLYPHLSVYGNLAFALKMRGTVRSEIRRRIADTAALLDIAALLDRRGWELSGGQKRRVALGRAIVRRPAVFLLDEPLTGLDAALRSQIRREIRCLHQRLGTTMIYVTHDQAEAMTLGDRLAVLRDGRLQQIADPVGLYRRPANRFVAALLGGPPMNFFPGRIDARDGRLTFRGRYFKFPISQSWGAALQSHVDRNVLLGIRPEHLRRSSAARSAVAATLLATVHGRELLGAEQHVDLRWAGGEITLRADSRENYGQNEAIKLAFSMEDVYFFDAATEKAIAAV